MIDFVAKWCEYSGEVEAQAWERMAVASALLRDEWQQMQFANASEFYRKSKTMIYDLLARAELQQHEIWPQVCAEWLKRYDCRSVLDFGCGVGAMGFGAAEAGLVAHVADVPSPSFAFVRWLAARGDMPLVLTCDSAAATKARLPWDSIICLEVFEHLLQPEKTATALVARLVRGGILFASWSFPGEDSDNPLHLNTGWTNDSFEGFLEHDCGLTWLNPGPCWARVLRKL